MKLPKMMRVKDGIEIQLTQTKVIAVILVGILAIAGTAGITYAALSYTGRIGSSGRIVAIGIKVTDVTTPTIDLKEIVWSDAQAGDVFTYQVLLRNNGSIPITVSMSVGDWIPLIAQQYIRITWDVPTTTILTKDQTLIATLTITIDQYITGVTDYSNLLYIIATQKNQ